MPEFLQFLADWLNEGERYDKMLRFITYFGLPLGIALLTLRFLQAGWRIYTGKQILVIASHTAEDMLHAKTPTKHGGA
jgi:C4-dicarboxylate transporter DctQ subunit